MAIENTSTSKYGVARGDDVLELFATVDEAKRQLAHIEDTMSRIGLEPDVDLIEVTETVTYSKAKAYKEPTVEDDEPTDVDSSPAE